MGELQTSNAAGPPRGGRDVAKPAGPPAFRRMALDAGGRSGARPGALPDDIAFLARAGVAPATLAHAARVAGSKGMAASEVLIARGMISRGAYERALAETVGAVYRAGGPDPGHVVTRVAPGAAGPHCAAVVGSDGGTRRLFIAPQLGGYARILRLAAGTPDLYRGAAFTGQMALRRALFEQRRQSLAEQACSRLAWRHPEFSASRRLSRGQTIVLGVGGIAAVLGTALDARAALLVLAILLSGFYAAIVALRTMLIVLLDRAGPARESPCPAAAGAPEDFPVYSILVALKGEAGQVPALIRSLDQLDWPASRREVFLICEEDDPDTIFAIRRFPLPEGFHLVTCPPRAPRTKPKALDFALPLCSGRFTVIYDAEDRPHRLQLREAWAKLESGGGRLACVQAPLLVHNRRQNWLTRMFAIEYRTQFLGTLPILETLRAPLSLGGTSNHFVTAHLKAAGGWDPHNVTEDADLGIRLARLGYRCGTISSPTWEEAPPLASVWLRQRTRWLKGWLQTVLVHSRNPLRTARELGATDTVFFHLTITAVVISMLVHPFFLAALVADVVALVAIEGHHADPAMLGVSMFNLAGGYTTYAFLALGVHRQTGERLSPILLSSLPIYWLMISVAGWRALFQLVSDPFRWEKTPHGLAKSSRSANIPHAPVADDGEAR